MIMIDGFQNQTRLDDIESEALKKTFKRPQHNFKTMYHRALLQTLTCVTEFVAILRTKSTNHLGPRK